MMVKGFYRFCVQKDVAERRKLFSFRFLQVINFISYTLLLQFPSDTNLIWYNRLKAIRTCNDEYFLTINSTDGDKLKRYLDIVKYQNTSYLCIAVQREIKLMRLHIFNINPIQTCWYKIEIIW